MIYVIESVSKWKLSENMEKLPASQKRNSYQCLTEDVGHRRLAEHSKYGDTLPLRFPDEEE